MVTCKVPANSCVHSSDHVSHVSQCDRWLCPPHLLQRSTSRELRTHTGWIILRTTALYDSQYSTISAYHWGNPLQELSKLGQRFVTKYSNFLQVLYGFFNALLGWGQGGQRCKKKQDGAICLNFAYCYIIYSRAETKRANLIERREQTGSHWWRMDSFTSREIGYKAWKLS